jgi:hypothetical protein
MRTTHSIKQCRYDIGHMHGEPPGGRHAARCRSLVDDGAAWRLVSYSLYTLHAMYTLLSKPEGGVPLNAVNGPVLVHYLVVLTGLQTS